MHHFLRFFRWEPALCCWFFTAEPVPSKEEFTTFQGTLKSLEMGKDEWDLRLNENPNHYEITLNVEKLSKVSLLSLKRREPLKVRVSNKDVERGTYKVAALSSKTHGPLISLDAYVEWSRMQTGLALIVGSIFSGIGIISSLVALYAACPQLFLTSQESQDLERRIANQKAQSSESPRQTGIVVLIVSLVGCKWMFLDALIAAHSHEPIVEYSLQSAFVSFYGILISIWLISGGRSVTDNAGQIKVQNAFWLAVVAAVLTGVFWFDIQSLGYVPRDAIKWNP